MARRRAEHAASGSRTPGGHASGPGVSVTRRRWALRAWDLERAEGQRGLSVVKEVAPNQSPCSAVSPCGRRVGAALRCGVNAALRNRLHSARRRRPNRRGRVDAALRSRVDAALRHRIDPALGSRVDPALRHRIDPALRHRIDPALGNRMTPARRRGSDRRSGVSTAAEGCRCAGWEGQRAMAVGLRSGQLPGESRAVVALGRHLVSARSSRNRKGQRAGGHSDRPSRRLALGALRDLSQDLVGLGGLKPARTNHGAAEVAPAVDELVTLSEGQELGSLCRLEPACAREGLGDGALQGVHTLPIVHSRTIPSNANRSARSASLAAICRRLTASTLPNHDSGGSALASVDSAPGPKGCP
jgi:hypothetical protein